MIEKNLKLDEALLALVEAGEPAYELNGQCFDSMVQALEIRHQQLEGNRPVSRRLGDLQSWLDSVESASVSDGFRQLCGMGKAAVSDFYPEKNVAEEFVRATVSWLRMTGWELPVYVPRIRFAPLEINQTGFDSGGRYRRFRLMRGSVTRVSSEVLVISAAIQGDASWEGQAMGALDLTLRLGPVERRLVYGDGLEVVVRSPLHPEAAFDRVLIVGVPSEWGGLSVDQYEVMVRVMLTALRAEETWAEGLNSISCSFLGGNRLECSETEAVTLLVNTMRTWLRNSQEGIDVQVFLLNPDEVASFSEAMDEALGRAVERVTDHPIVEPLRLQLLDAFAQLPPALRKAADPLSDTLQSPGGLTVELVCTFARVWAEQLVTYLLKEANVKPSGEFLRSIEKLRENGLVSPWIAGYMHTCRILGNKSVHPPKKPPAYTPSSLTSTDLVAVLSALHALALYANSK